MKRKELEVEEKECGVLTLVAPLDPGETRVIELESRDEQ